MAVIRAIRKYKPQIVLANAVQDRHVDHGKGAALASDACFLAGLAKIETFDDQGVKQEAWRPSAVYHYIQSYYLTPDFVVDITGFWDIKLKAIMAFKSQFYDPASKEPATFISDPAFLRMMESRAQELGHSIGVQHGEGFTLRRTPGVNSLFDLK